MVSPAASWPKTALTVTRVSRMHGRPLIRFGPIVIRSYATLSAYARRPSAAQRTEHALLIATCQMFITRLSGVR